MDFFVKCFVFLDFMVTVDLLLPVGESALTTMVDNQFLCLIANLSVWLTPLGTLPTFTPSFLLLLLSSCGIIPIDDRIWDATCYNLFSSILICQLTATFKFRKFRFRLIYPLDLLVVSGFPKISIDFGNCNTFIINKVFLWCRNGQQTAV